MPQSCREIRLQGLLSSPSAKESLREYMLSYESQVSLHGLELLIKFYRIAIRSAELRTVPMDIAKGFQSFLLWLQEERGPQSGGGEGRGNSKAIRPGKGGRDEGGARGGDCGCGEG